MKFLNITAMFSLVCCLCSCTKDALDQKTISTLAIPSTIDDYQQLLDGLEGGNQINAPSLYSARTLGDYLADETYVSDANFNSYFSGSPFIKGVLTWDKNMFTSLTSSAEWDRAYQGVLYTNLALEGLAKITPDAGNQKAWNLAEGIALFIRGQLFYNIAQFWSPLYNPATAATDKGIVLRLSSDADAVSTRATVKDSYAQILKDLQASVPLLPDNSSLNTQVSKVRPSKAAAYGMIARVYLAMGDSANVFKYADSALQLYSALMDYNTLTGFDNFNAETVYSSMDLSGTIGGVYGRWYVDSNLIALYDANDLRKSLYFVNNSYTQGNVFVGDYSRNYYFTGIAVDELYLLRAEASARMGQITEAMSDLNTLLVQRYKTGTFTPLSASNPTEALTKILLERRKELVMRGERWMDLRRLNTDPRFAKTLTRSLLGIAYTLPPGDSRYVLQVPLYVMRASNGSITQNP